VSLSLKNLYITKKNSMGYAKKGKKRKMSMPKGMREKNVGQRA
jgi:hypothetical protein